MLHTTLLTSLTNTGLTLSTQRSLEVAALVPNTPSTGVALLDAALEACVLTQVGLVDIIPSLGVFVGVATLEGGFVGSG